MKNLFALTLFFCIAFCQAQTKLELTPQGFQSIQMKSPNRPMDKIMDAAKAWVPYYNKKAYDISEVTANSLVIEARNESAFYYYNVGVKYDQDIVYRMKIVFNEDATYTLKISVKEIYAENVLLKTTTADFFNAEGKLKDDFRDAKPSLEKTINNIVKSFTAFMAQ